MIIIYLQNPAIPECFLDYVYYTYFVLDRENVIRHKLLGKADQKGLDRIVRSLL